MIGRAEEEIEHDLLVVLDLTARDGPLEQCWFRSGPTARSRQALARSWSCCAAAMRPARWARPCESPRGPRSAALRPGRYEGFPQ
ncbi:MAG TPA: hypothetical protein VLW50_04650 [Streptosporangiaceae bacterium]|nr:hypothetical protein [Streptosporangiaceae bacterium]